MTGAKGAALTGFLATDQYNKDAIYTLLEENGMKGRHKGKREEMGTVLSRYTENEYFKSAFATSKRADTDAVLNS